MKTNSTALNYKGYRFPPEIISHVVWLYFRFSLSFRDIEEMMAERGVMVTYAHDSAMVSEIWANVC